MITKWKKLVSQAAALVLFAACITPRAHAAADGDSADAAEDRDQDDADGTDSASSASASSSSSSSSDGEHHHQHSHWRSDSSDDDDDSGTGTRVSGDGSHAQVEVKGPVQLRLSVQSGDVELVGTSKAQVHATLRGTHTSRSISLVQRGERIEVLFGDQRQLRRGHLLVELPAGSGAQVSSMSGDVEVTGLSGEVDVSTLSGDVHASQIGPAEIQTVSGDVVIDGATGKLRVHTVSGDANIQSAQATGQLEFESTSGGLKWSGGCFKDCHLSAETVSGDVRLVLDPKSSFELSYGSHSGDLDDGLQMSVTRKPHRKGSSGGWTEAVYGKGEGVIECDTFSGDVTLEKR